MKKKSRPSKSEVKQKMREKVLRMIANGSPAKPVVSQKIESKLKIPGTYVRTAVRSLRRNGTLIHGTDQGYHLISTKAQYADLRKSLNHRVASIKKTIKDMDRFAKHKFGSK
jgi:biotin operon repressor